MVKINRTSNVLQGFIACFVILGAVFQVGCGSYYVQPQNQNIIIGSKSAVIETAIKNHGDGFQNHFNNKEAIPAVEFKNTSEKMAVMPIAPNHKASNQPAPQKALASLRNEMKVYTIAAKRILADSTQPTAAQQQEFERLAKGKKRAIIGAILATLGVGGSAGAFPVLLIPFAMFFCISSLRLLNKGDKGRGWAIFGLVISSIFLLLLLLAILYIVVYGI